MLRKVYLDGELGDKYGKELTINASTFADVFRCLDCNFPDFRSYLIECEEAGVGFVLEVNDAPVTSDLELLINYNEGDMVISPQPAGSKGALKIIAAIVIAVLIVSNPAGWAIAGGSLTTAGTLAASFAISLAISGLAEMMAPDPATEKSFTQDNSYLFQGAGQTIVEGDPIPVLYGQLRVPGRAVSFDIRNTRSAYQSHGVGIGNVGLVGSEVLLENVSSTVASSNSRTPGQTVGISNTADIKLEQVGLENLA